MLRGWKRPVVLSTNWKIWKHEGEWKRWQFSLTKRIWFAITISWKAKRRQFTSENLSLPSVVRQKDPTHKGVYLHGLLTCPWFIARNFLLPPSSYSIIPNSHPFPSTTEQALKEEEKQRKEKKNKSGFAEFHSFSPSGFCFGLSYKKIGFILTWVFLFLSSVCVSQGEGQATRGGRWSTCPCWFFCFRFFFLIPSLFLVGKIKQISKLAAFLALFQSWFVAIHWKWLVSNRILKLPVLLIDILELWCFAKLRGYIITALNVCLFSLIHMFEFIGKVCCTRYCPQICIC